MEIENKEYKSESAELQEYQDHTDSFQSILRLIKELLKAITFFSVICELIFFPSVDNFCGCIMMIVSLFLFSFFLDRFFIIERPFSFLMLLSGFCYHWLPVPAMLLNWRSVSYGMERPIITFLLETLSFILMCMVFDFSSRTSKKNGFCTRLWNTFGMYETPRRSVIWAMGVLGCLGKIYFLSNGGVEIGNIISQFLNIWSLYMYIPVVLFFPCLYRNNTEEGMNFRQPRLWFYIICICILNLSTNSRNKVIWPFAIMILLSFISLIYCRRKAKEVFNVSKILKYVTISFVLLSIFTNISHAVLLNRSIRSDVSFTELIHATVTTLLADSFSESWARYKSSNSQNGSYREGWVETYIDNEWLNRFCNIRISDETLYYGSTLSESEKESFQVDFLNRAISTYPEPIIRLFSSTYDKSQYTSNSRGDMLYYYSGYGSIYSLGGFRVTSHLGDGMATFGWWYFPIQIFFWYIVMRLLNTFQLYREEKAYYSLLGLMNVYSFLLRFQNSNGMIIDVQYVIRGYWQECILFVATFFAVNLIVRSFAKIE